jgi:hypothetical protein
MVSERVPSNRERVAVEADSTCSGVSQEGRPGPQKSLFSFPGVHRWDPVIPARLVITVNDVIHGSVEGSHAAKDAVQGEGGEGCDHGSLPPLVHPAH